MHPAFCVDMLVLKNPMYAERQSGVRQSHSNFDSAINIGNKSLLKLYSNPGITNIKNISFNRDFLIIRCKYHAGPQFFCFMSGMITLFSINDITLTKIDCNVNFPSEIICIYTVLVIFLIGKLSNTFPGRLFVFTWTQRPRHFHAHPT